MMLRRKMAFQTGALIVSLLLISGGSLWGLNGLHQDFGSALRGNTQLRRVFEIGSHVQAARKYLDQAEAQPQRALAEFNAALASAQSTFAPASANQTDQKIETLLLQPLRQMRTEIRAHDADWSVLITRLDVMQHQIADLASEIRSRIQKSQDDADHKRHATIVLMASLSAGVVIAAVAIGIYQYRGVIKPLNRLGEGVRDIAGGSFTRRMKVEGDTEFASLAKDFNRMAAELDSLYRELEQKVAVKSRELVRSERLASVGYLAAGVAHEINNPLGIIAGYAELTLKELSQDQSQSESAKSLRIICEEAFRCKEITQKLLSLARPGSDVRTRHSLSAAAREVVSILAGLQNFRERMLTVEAPEACEILASESEIKQVLLNLAINALEATSAVGGKVHISVDRTADNVTLTITDNGRGMDAQTLERVFEPFFTDKRGAGKPGTGLGLSITHAIIESHGGSIRAESDGLGHGSRFIISLPANQPPSSQTATIAALTHNIQ